MKRREQILSDWLIVLVCLIILCVLPHLFIWAVICIKNTELLSRNMSNSWVDIAQLWVALISVLVAGATVAITVKNNRRILILERRRDQPCIDVIQGEEMVLSLLDSELLSIRNNDLYIRVQKPLGYSEAEKSTKKEDLKDQMSICHLSLRFPISNCGSGTIKRIKVERIVIDCEDIFSYDNEQLRRGAPQIQGTYRIKSDDGKLYLRIDCQYLVPVEKIKTYNAIRQADAKKGLLLTNIEMHLRLFALNGFEYKEVLKIYTDMERIDEEERYFVRSDVELLEPIID